MLAFAVASCGGGSPDDPPENPSVTSSSVVGTDLTDVTSPSKVSVEGGSATVGSTPEEDSGVEQELGPTTDVPGGDEEQPADTQSTSTTEAPVEGETEADGSAGLSTPTTTEAPYNSPESYEPSTDGGYTSAEPDA